MNHEREQSVHTLQHRLAIREIASKPMSYLNMGSSVARRIAAMSTRVVRSAKRDTRVRDRWISPQQPEPPTAQEQGPHSDVADMDQDDYAKQFDSMDSSASPAIRAPAVSNKRSHPISSDHDALSRKRSRTTIPPGQSVRSDWIPGL